MGVGLTRKELKALEDEGFRVGTVQELLDLSDEEVVYIEIKVALARALKEMRAKKRLTQADVAELVGSTQPRVARMERGEATLDLLIRGLLALGASAKEIGRKVGAAVTAA